MSRLKTWIDNNEYLVPYDSSKWLNVQRFSNSESYIFNSEDISHDLSETRERTFLIMSFLNDSGLIQQFNPLMGPIFWDFLHIGYFEKLWLLDIDSSIEKCIDDRGLLPKSFDAFETPRRTRKNVFDDISKETVLKTVNHIRKNILNSLNNMSCQSLHGSIFSNGFVWNMCLQHENWHQETMIVAQNLLPKTCFHSQKTLEHKACDLAVDDCEMIDIPAGEFVMGTNHYGKAYDNEMGAHPVFVDDFKIERFPVSNRRYILYLEESHTEPPLNWFKENGVWKRIWFGQVEDIYPYEPVVCVSFDEAKAFAQYYNLDLPSEVEWEKAASWDPSLHQKRLYPWGDSDITPDKCNVNGITFGRPSQLGSLYAGRSFYGCEHMLGDCWEWTNDTLYLFPSYRPWPYFSFTLPFVGRDKVLKGGSWATGSNLIRNTLRNWDLPIRKQIFVGFRCVKR